MRFLPNTGITSVEDIEQALESAKKYVVIDKNALDDECLKQPILIEQISKVVAITKSMYETAYENLKVLKAQIYLEKREENESSGKRVSEGMLEALIQADERYIDQLKLMQQYRRLYDEAMAIKDSFVQKSYMLKELILLYTTEYFSITPVKTSVQTQQENNEYRQAQIAINQIKETRREKEYKILEKIRQQREE